MGHYLVTPEVREAAERASFLIVGVSEVGGRSSKRKRQEMSQVGMGFFYTPTSALTCAHNLPEAALKLGQFIRALERGMHSSAHALIMGCSRPIMRHRIWACWLECGSCNNVASPSYDSAHANTSSHLRSSYGHAFLTEIQCNECTAALAIHGNESARVQ